MPNPSYLFGGKSRVTIPSELHTKTDLLKYLGMSPAELRTVWCSRARMYHHFNISKMSGKFRMISAPDDRLKMIQKKIAISLSKLYRHRHPVHGFIQDRSVRTNAETHLRPCYILNIDLKDFFPSISEQRVIGLLQSLNVDADVSAIIARICCNQGCLPQGAPSSPVISNMICFRLDKSLMDFAKAHRMLYTRYADDISLSSFQPPSAVFGGARPSAGKLEPQKISDELRQLILGNGFEMNPNKIHYADKNARRVVTGLKVNEGLNVDRSFVRNIRAALYKVEDIGVAPAQAELASRFGKNCSIQAHLRGKISWVGFVKGQSDPVFCGLAIRYNECFPSNIIKSHPTPNETWDRAVWVLEHENNQGTAFFLKGIGLVTAAHCVEGATKIELFHPSRPSNSFKVGIAHLCRHRDLALLDHSLPSSEFFELDEFAGSLTVGASTVAAGYPSYGPGDKLNIRKGTISSFTVKHAVRLIEVTQKLSQGMSGEPLLTDDNSVLGVIHKGGPSEPRDFAVRLAELKTWVSGLP